MQQGKTHIVLLSCTKQQWLRTSKVTQGAQSGTVYLWANQSWKSTSIELTSIEGQGSLRHSIWPRCDLQDRQCCIYGYHDPQLQVVQCSQVEGGSPDNIHFMDCAQKDKSASTCQGQTGTMAWVHTDFGVQGQVHHLVRSCCLYNHSKTSSCKCIL